MRPVKGRKEKTRKDYSGIESQGYRSKFG